MAKPMPRTRLSGRLWYLGLALGLIFSAILPIGGGSGDVPGPDLLLVATMVWVMRRPEEVPVLVLAGVFLLADFIFLRPPGLMPVAVVLAAEFLRNRDDLTTEVPFAVEWAVAGGIMSSVVIGSAAFAIIFGALAPALGPMLIQLVLGVICYGPAAVVGRTLFGLGRRQRGDEYRFGTAS